DKPTASDRLQLAHVRTNRYGVAHIHANPLPASLAVSYGAYSRIQLLVEARDGRGGNGVHTELLWMHGSQYFHVKPIKRLFLDGETVAADIEASAPDQTLFVDLLGREGVLGSSRVQLHHGRAHVEFPYNQDFRGNLYIAAYNMKSEENATVSGSATVLFPEPQNLDLGVRLDRATYKPGESASAQFRVRDPDGHAEKTALGIVVYDKAVAERVRSDEEFGTYGFYFDHNDWSAYGSIAGFTYRDLINRKLTKWVPPDWEL